MRFILPIAFFAAWGICAPALTQNSGREVTASDSADDSVVYPDYRREEGAASPADEDVVYPDYRRDEAASGSADEDIVYPDY